MTCARTRPRSLSDDQADLVATIEERLMAAMTNVKRLHDAGVLVVAGTDAPYPRRLPGRGGSTANWSCLSRPGSLRCRRSRPRPAARPASWARATSGGTIAPGLAADLVVVRGNPADDIGATRDIVAVIQRGVLLDRSALSFASLDDPGFRTVGIGGGELRGVASALR